MLQVEDGFFAHVDFKALFAIHRRALVLFFHQPDKVAHFALERYIGHQAMARFGIQARHIARVRVAVGVAVFDIKNQHKVVAVGEGLGGAHAGVPSVLVVVCAVASVFLLKKSCRWW